MNVCMYRKKFSALVPIEYTLASLVETIVEDGMLADFLAS